MGEDKTKIALTHQVIFFDLVRNRVIEVFDGMVFGRTQGNETFQEDCLLSRSHFKVKTENSKIYIEDLKSTNKTKINGNVVPANQPIEISIGSLIEFGNQKFEVRSGKNPQQSLNPHPSPFSPSQAATSKAASPSKLISWSEGAIEFLSPLKNWTWSTWVVFIIFAILATFTQMLQPDKWAHSTIVYEDSKAFPHVSQKEHYTTAPDLPVAPSTPIPPCEESFFPISERSMLAHRSITNLLAGLLAAFIQHMSGLWLSRKHPAKLLILLFSAAGSSSFISLFDQLPEQTRLNATISTCACPKNLDLLNFDRCNSFVKGQDYKTNLPVKKKFSEIPLPAQVAIISNLKLHPFFKLTQEETAEVIKTYYKGYDNFKLRNYEQSLLDFKTLHQKVPQGFWGSKLMENSATRYVPKTLQNPIQNGTRNPNYIGCFKDVSTRVFRESGVSRMSISDCNALAKKANSPVFGMQDFSADSTQSGLGTCWYGASEAQAKAYDVSTKCYPGKDDVLIGGPWHNALYRTY